jgi:hypothetical protein
MICFIAFTAGLLTLLHFTKFNKRKTFMWIILVTFALSLSRLLYDAFNSSDARSVLPDNLVWLSSYCHFSMYGMLFLSLFAKKEKTFNFWACFLGVAAIIASTATLFSYPSFFQEDGETAFSFGRLSSTFWHSGLLVGGLYLFTSGLVKIRVFNIFSMVGAMLFGPWLYATALNPLFLWTNGVNRNLLNFSGPLEGIALFPVFCMMGIVLWVVFTAIWEQFAIKNPQERWYHNKKYFTDKLTEVRAWGVKQWIIFSLLTALAIWIIVWAILLGTVFKV